MPDRLRCGTMRACLASAARLARLPLESMGTTSSTGGTALAGLSQSASSPPLFSLLGGAWRRGEAQAQG